MVIKQAIASEGQFLSDQRVLETLQEGLAGKYGKQSVLVLIPDHTRSLPLPRLFRALVEIFDDVRQLDFLVALGTHPALSDHQINSLVGISSEERSSTYRNIGFYNHCWDQPDELISLGAFDAAELREIAGNRWHSSLPGEVPIQINKHIQNYDQILILGPVFPHEVVGLSGGSKYLFPGISGPEMINATHWLGALAGVVDTIGFKETPVREMIERAARLVNVPVQIIALTVEGQDVSGVFVGEVKEAWNAAVEVSQQRHICWVNRPYQKVLSCAPPMYDELWTAAKAMYKLEPAVAVGGEVVIYAPHLSEVSLVHGKYIYEIGYHTLPYFLQDWQRFQHIPLGVLAHSTHVRGSGHIENGIEKPNVKVTLASQISAEDCQRLNLGYLDPAQIRVEDWQNREDEGILYVPKAGEILYRVRK